MRGTVSIALLATLMGGTGCDGRTQVVVRVQGPGLGPVYELGFSVENAGTYEPLTILPPSGTGAITLPTTIGLTLRRGEPGPVQVCVTAYLDGGSSRSSCVTGDIVRGDPTYVTVDLGPCASLPEGTLCDDLRACTGPDACQSGACTGPPPDCTFLVDQCNSARCDEAAGGCVAVPEPDGTACSGSSCSGPATCQGGACGPPGMEIPGNPSCCNACDDDADSFADDADADCCPAQCGTDACAAPSCGGAACCSLDLCGGSATCPAGCTCDFWCYTNAGWCPSTCDLTCDGASTTCNVACSAGVSCTIACTGGAACLVDCGTSTSCTFSSCPTTAKVCPGTTYLACNRACP